MSGELKGNELVQARELLEDAGMVPEQELPLKPTLKQSISGPKAQAPAPVDPAIEATISAKTQEAQARYQDLAQAEAGLQNQYNQLEAYLAGAEFQHLQQTDPGQAANLQVQIQTRAAQLQKAWADLQPYRVAYGHTVLEKANAETVALIPSWKNPAVKEREAQELFDYGVSLGYDRKQLANSLDARAIKLLRDSWIASKAKTNPRQAKQLLKQEQQGDLGSAIAANIEANRKRGITSQDGRISAVSKALADLGIDL